MTTPITIMSPAPGATGTVVKPILRWTPYEGALWYEVTLSEDPSFTQPEWSHNIRGTVYVSGIIESLKYGTTYYWRVRGVTGEPYVQGAKFVIPAGPWTVGKFTTSNEAPSFFQIKKPTQVFVSHTKKDEEFCDILDRAFARVGIRAFRSEFEEISLPAWQTIREAIRNSCALFLVAGKELVKAQLLHKSSSWEHTQNWIAYEIGVACERGIDVWVICDNTRINFPVPYLNNYLPRSIRNRQTFNYFVYTLKRYAEGLKTNFPDPKDVVECPQKNCKAIFNLPVTLKAGGTTVCPQCLRPIKFPNGWQ